MKDHCLTHFILTHVYRNMTRQSSFVDPEGENVTRFRLDAKRLQSIVVFVVKEVCDAVGEHFAVGHPSVVTQLGSCLVIEANVSRSTSQKADAIDASPRPSLVLEFDAYVGSQGVNPLLSCGHQNLLPLSLVPSTLTG
jgi:hypothetical protein